MADNSEANVDVKRSIVDSQSKKSEIVESAKSIVSLKQPNASQTKVPDNDKSTLSRSDSGFLDSESDSQKHDAGANSVVKYVPDSSVKKSLDGLNKKIKEQSKNDSFKCTISDVNESLSKSSKPKQKDKHGKENETKIPSDDGPISSKISDAKVSKEIEIEKNITILAGKLSKTESTLEEENIQSNSKIDKLSSKHRNPASKNSDNKNFKNEHLSVCIKSLEKNNQNIAELSQKPMQTLQKPIKLLESEIETDYPSKSIVNIIEKEKPKKLDKDCHSNIDCDIAQNKKLKNDENLTDIKDKENQTNNDSEKDCNNSKKILSIDKNKNDNLKKDHELSKNEKTLDSDKQCKEDSRTRIKKRNITENVDKGNENDIVLGVISDFDANSHDNELCSNNNTSKEFMDNMVELTGKKIKNLSDNLKDKNLEFSENDTSTNKDIKCNKTQNKEIESCTNNNERNNTQNHEKNTESVSGVKKDGLTKKNQIVTKMEEKTKHEKMKASTDSKNTKSVSEKNNTEEINDRKLEENDKNSDNQKPKVENDIVDKLEKNPEIDDSTKDEESQSVIENGKRVKDKKGKSENTKKNKMKEKTGKTDISEEHLLEEYPDPKAIENNDFKPKGVESKGKNDSTVIVSRKSSERIRVRETSKGKNVLKEPKKSPDKKDDAAKTEERIGVELRPRRKAENKIPAPSKPQTQKQTRNRSSEGKNLSLVEENKATGESPLSEKKNGDKGRGIDAIASKLVKIKAEPEDRSSPMESSVSPDHISGKSKNLGSAKKISASTDKNDKPPDLDTEMKGYAADAMNELLGLYGYDKVDETEKNNLNLSNSLLKTTPSTAASAKKQASQSSTSTIPQTTVVTTTNSSSTTSTTTSTSTTPSNTNSSSSDKSVQKQHPCIVCRQIKKCKYNIVRNGDVRYLCEDDCFQKFRAKPTDYLQVIDSGPKKCHVCQKEISMPGGMLPLPGDPTKPVCSEQCSKNYQIEQGPQKVCSQCKFAIQSGKKFLSWETMEFCCEECLGKYQTGLGAHCNFCHAEIQRTLLGKHCIKVGSDIKQFCTNNCLDEFRKGLKVCNYCQKDLSNNPEGFLAPVGDKGEFKDFCSQTCMEKYDSKLKDRNNWNSGSNQTCSVCKKTGTIKNEVMHEGTKYYLCSDTCISSFSFSNNLTIGTCDNCGVFCYNDKSQPFFIQFEGKTKRFCSDMCVCTFRLAYSKIAVCTWCKSKKYNFDMIERVDTNNKYQHFCSLNCLSLFRVSLSATSSRSVPCDCCKQVVPAQYHLTMSDASVRNFCSYSCVVQFQNQFTGASSIISRTQGQQQNTNIATQGQVSQSSPSLIASSVVSLASANQQTTQQQTTVGKRQTQNKTTSAFNAQQNPVTTLSRRVSSNNAHNSTSLPATTPTSRVKESPVSQKAVTQSSTSSPTIQQQIIIQHPPPKQLKNKALLCKPFMQTKATSCRPHTSSKETQTEDYIGKPVVIPVPVPVYVPIPMHLYTMPVPFPIALPIPIPVPCFIPTTKNSADNILRHIKEIQDKIPADPFEAELLMMAEMVASGDTHTAESKESSEVGEAEPSADHTGADFQMDSQDPLHATNVLGDDMLQMALRMASEMSGPAVDLETALAPDANSQESDFGVLDENGDMVNSRDVRARQRSQKRTSSGRGGRRGKRARIEEPHPVTSSPDLLTTDASMCLKYTYGVNAWKHWVLQKNAALEKASQRSGKLKLFKTDLLQLTADELNYSLCLFVKEVRKPNGEEYASDSIYYLCLGIQQYLFENCRIDNIFTDIYYEKFTECLNEIVQRYEVRFNEAGLLVCRIEEEILWESKQLGAHSPHVLLNSLLYFNTKYFLLKTPEDHQRLSFSHVMKQWRKSQSDSKNNSGRAMYLRYCPPINGRDMKGKRDELTAVFEQQENIDNPLRCPVKLYEFYLSKCPESIKNRNDVFYLVPERSCVPDSPVWYSTQPLGKEALSKMLHRIKMVREVNETYMQKA